MDKIVKIILIILTLCIITGVCFRKKENFAKNKLSKKKCKNLGRKFKNGKCTNKCLNKKFKFNKNKKKCIRIKKKSKKEKNNIKLNENDELMYAIKMCKKFGRKFKKGKCTKICLNKNSYFYEYKCINPIAIKKCLTKHLKGVGCTSISTRAKELNIENKCKIPNNPKMKKQVYNHVKKICNPNKPIPNDQFKGLVRKYMKAILEPIARQYQANYDMIWQQDNDESIIRQKYKDSFDHKNIYKIKKKINKDIDNNFDNLMKKNKIFRDIVNKYGKIENWNVSKVEDMSYSFNFNNENDNYWIPHIIESTGVSITVIIPKIDLSNWDVSNVRNMSHMFSTGLTSLLVAQNHRNCYIDFNISDWDVSNVRNMSHMFKYCFFKSNISSWIVGNVTDMSYMFMCAKSYSSLDLSNWDVSNVTDMSHMFNNVCGEVSELVAKNINFKGMSNWNVSNVTNMSSMFNYTSFNEDISNWNVSNVTDMSKMFYFPSNNISLKYGEGGKRGITVVDDDGKVKYHTNLSQDKIKLIDKKWEEYRKLSKTKMSDDEIFKNIGMSFITHFNRDLSKWKWPEGKVPKHDGFAVLNSEFKDDTLFTKDRYPPQFLNNKLGYEPPNKPKYKPIPNDQFKQLVYDYFVGGRVTNDDNNLVNVEMPDLTQPKTLKIIKEYGSIEDWNVSQVKDMSRSFSMLPNNVFGVAKSWIQKYNCDLSNWDVSNVTNMMEMFGKFRFSRDRDAVNGYNEDIYCPNFDVCSLQSEIGLTKDIRKEESVYQYNQNYRSETFAQGNTFNSDLSKWDVSNVNNMAGMFTDCYNFDASTIKNWNVSNVTNMRGMFHNASINFIYNKKNINNKIYDFSKWNVSKVTDVSYMFTNNYDAGLDYDSKDLTNHKIEISGISSWKLPKVKYMDCFLQGAKINEDFSHWKWPENKIPTHYDFVRNIVKDYWPPQFRKDYGRLKPDIKFKVKPSYNKDTQKLTFTILNDSISYTRGLASYTKEGKLKKNDFRKNLHLIRFKDINGKYQNVNFELNQNRNYLENQVYFSKGGEVANKHLGPNGEQEFELPVGPLKPGIYAIFLDYIHSTNNYAEFIVPN